MRDNATMHVGPLGSTVHVLRADAETVEQLAAIDWNRHFRRVCLDPVRRLTTLEAVGGVSPLVPETSAHPRHLVDQVEERGRVQEQRQAAGRGDDDCDEAGRRGLPNSGILPFGPLPVPG